MGCCNISTPMMMIMAVAILGSMTSSTKAQPTQSCAQDLTPCAEYLNSTATPSTECCTAIKQTVASQLTCLCGLFYTPGIIESLGGTTKALRVSTACGVDAGVEKCKAVLGQAPTNSQPTTPGGDGDSGSGRIAWIGFPALLMFWASVMIY